MRKWIRTAKAAMIVTLATASPGVAQGGARAEDVATPENLVSAVYESLARAPGENFDWERFRSLHLPEALLVPNIAQTGGESHVMGVEEFIDWVDAYYEENVPIGSPEDQGFVEEGIHLVKHEYGDVVHLMSTYEKRFHDQDEVLGRGVNSMSLVRRDGRWWIVSTAWDEEKASGPIPREYLAAAEARAEDVESVDALIDASYQTLQRAPGEPFAWDRYHTLRLPRALLVPNTEQSGGTFAPRTTDEHVSGIEAWFADNEDFIGGPNDQGFAEEEIHRSVQRYGDVAHVQSTYVKRTHDSDEIIGRGVNFYTLVFDGDRWWLSAAAWDEETGAGEIPAELLP